MLVMLVETGPGVEAGAVADDVRDGDALILTFWVHVFVHALGC